MRLLKLLLVLFVCAAGPAVAGPFEDATAAYYRGDYATALRLWRPLAEQGNAGAQYNVGLMYNTGLGVPPSYATTVFWFRKAADQGHAQAQSDLGYMYENGRGVLDDYVTAVFWFRKAADQGNEVGQYNLGRMYANGRGVPQDYVQAHKWLNLAASRVDTKERRDEAITKRDWLAAQMTPTQIAEAQKLAHEWKSTLLVVSPPPQRSTAGLSIPMKKEGGIYVIPVLINNAITLDFIVDSGASDVTIPEDVVSTLIRAGTIKGTDFIGEQTYVLADGSRVKSKTFRIRSLKVGDRVLENVTGSVASTKGTLLLGQSFLVRFKSWSIDNSKHLLILSDDSPTLAPPGTSTPYAPPQASAPVGVADQIYNDAFKKLQDGDYSGAADGFKTFVQRNPQHALAGNAQYWLGETYYARRDYQNAMTAFAEGYKNYKASPKGPDNLLKLGVTLATLGRKSDACAIFARFGQDYPRATELQKRRIEQERQKNGCG